jgi:hypothetical protein
MRCSPAAASSREPPAGPGGASVVSGNEPCKVRSAGDSRSLRIFQSLEVQLVFTTSAGRSGVQIADISVDPCVRG